MKMTQTQKPIIIIGLIMLIIFGGVYGYLARPEIITSPIQDICGDGICSEVERFSKSCEKDCGEIIDKSRKEAVAHFGFYGPVEVIPLLHEKNIFTKSRDYKSLAKILKDAGGDWVYIFGPSLIMGGTEFVWAFDEQKFQIVIEVPTDSFEPRRLIDPILLPKDLVNYERELRNFFKKYKVAKIWNLGDEADQSAYDDTPENFAIQFRIAYKILKEIDPEAKLILGKQAWWIFSFLEEQPSPEILRQMGPAYASIPEEERSFALRLLRELELLETIEKNPQKDNKYKNNPEISEEEYNLIFKKDNIERYIDGVTLSFWHPSVSMIQEWRQQVINNLKSHTLEDKILQWSIDTLGYYTATNIGGPERSDRLFPEEVNERIGAMAFVKGASIQGTSLSEETAYIRLFANGFEKIGYSGYLINSDGSKRLEWFTHKLMAEKLKGFTSAEKIAEGQYKFNFKDKNAVWVLWRYGLKEKTVTLDVGDVSAVKITGTVPKYNSGKEITDYNTAFEAETISVNNGKITLTLDEEPVYVEKKPEITEMPLQASKQKTSPFCLWTQGPMISRQHSKEEIPFIKDLGVNFIVVPAFPLNFDKKHADNNFPEAQKSFEVYKNSGLMVVPNSEDPTKVSIKESSEALKKALEIFPQNKYWVIFGEIDAVVPPGGYFKETDFQDNYYKSVARKWALNIRLFYRVIKNHNSQYQVASPGTGGDSRSYLTQGTKYFDDLNNQNATMKFNGFFVHYMDALKEFEEIEKNPNLYDWNNNELKLTKEEFALVFSKDSHTQYFDIHQYSNFDNDASKYYESTTKLAKAIKDLFKKYGYENVKLWLTQTSTHTGKIESKVFGNGLNQTEIEQAEYLVKKYITSIVSGVDIICWTGPFEMQWGDSMEFGSLPNYQHFFSQVGLIYDGNGKYDEGAKLGKKDEIKKLSYYVYKKMVEILDGSNWDNVQTVQEKNGVYVYKFVKNNKPIWVVWNDNSGIKIIILNIGNILAAKITKAIPKYNSGKEVKDYDAAFETETKTAENGKITLTIGENPVYVEGE